MITVPAYIYKKGRWYYNTKTGKYIHPDHIASVLEAIKPKQAPPSPPLDNRRWDLNY